MAEPTMKQIAAEAGVSIATVSFALNKTRYVSPELVGRIEEIARRNGYAVKSKNKNGFRSGKLSEIALVIPSVKSNFYAQLITTISETVAAKGYLVSAHITNNDYEQERRVLRELGTNKRIAGIILSPASEDGYHYRRLLDGGIPLVCIERTITGQQVNSVLSDNTKGIFMGVEHLIKRGHENIAILLEDRHLSCVEERRAGYLQALEYYNIPINDNMIVSVSAEDDQLLLEKLQILFERDRPTAIFAGGNKLTLSLLRALAVLDKDCFSDISVIGFGDAQWCDLVKPPLTVLKQDQHEISRHAVDCVVGQIEGLAGREEVCRIAMELSVRDSVQNIARGPFGEKIEYPGDIILSEAEEEQLRQEHFKVGISFHYGGDEWTALNEKAITETLGGYGVRVVSVMDAHFDAELQKKQLAALMMQDPDVIIAVPVDEEKTAEVFKEISAKTKLVLINSMPRGFTREDYACWISVNERENGENAARILGDYLRMAKKRNVGLLIHGKEYFATKQRDFFARQTLAESYPELTIAACEAFGAIEDTYRVCQEMVSRNPGIEGIYVTWERPALEAIRALKDMGRNDIVISTTDLDYEIARHLAAQDMVIGLSSQRPYDQGVVTAIAAARVLLGKNNGKCIGVPPYRIEKSSLEKAWKELRKTKMPDLVKK